MLYTLGCIWLSLQPLTTDFVSCLILVIRPNLDSYVFVRVNEDTDGVLVEEETLDTGYVFTP